MGLTKDERRALLWVLAVAIAGAGVKVARQWRHSDDGLPTTQQALRLQLLAVDSAQRSERRPRRGRASRPRDQTRPSSSGQSSDAASSRREQPILTTMDLDVADSAALERLPRIGPSLAARIVADRSAQGPFGSMRGLERVRGIGPKLAAVLAPLVTFSGTPRPSTVRR